MTYLKFITLYQQNSLAKKKYYTIQKNKITLLLLKKFIQIGLVKSVKSNIKNTTLLYVYINYINNNNVYIKITTLYTLSKKKNVNIKTLLLKKKFNTNSTLLILTSKGLLTNFEAIAKNIGGVLLCQINY